MENNIPGPHGRETYIRTYGNMVMKHPLPYFSDAQKEAWLAKQYRTKEIIEEIKEKSGGCKYNVPTMVAIDDYEYGALEEFAPGKSLSLDLFKKLSKRQKIEIIDGIASFLVDMNEVREAKPEEMHKITTELKFARLCNFTADKMEHWFNIYDVRYMEKLLKKIDDFEYVTRQVWSHGDLNANNVLYDPNTSKLSFIDFAEANYNFVYHDIFAPIEMELDICPHVYELYTQLHNKDLYKVFGSKNPMIKNIMTYRIIGNLLKRFSHAADDLRLNPRDQKSERNNAEKVAFMKSLIMSMRSAEKCLVK